MLERDRGLSKGTDVTLEADPLTFDPARLKTFRELGFTRLSIGLQSLSDPVLSFLGRKHNAAEGRQAVEWGLEAGFEVSADIITAVPGQDAEQDLHGLARLGVQHISVYTLTLEPFTPFALRGVTVDDEQDRKSTRLNSSHVAISYAVFCLKKKKKRQCEYMQ